jgi:hypothetical protein
LSKSLGPKTSTLNLKKHPLRKEKGEQKVSTYIHKKDNTQKLQITQPRVTKVKNRDLPKKAKKTTYALNLSPVA